MVFSRELTLSQSLDDGFCGKQSLKADVEGIL